MLDYEQGDITIHWIPSHLGVEGNKQANKQAKCTVQGYTDSPLHILSTNLQNALLDSISTIKQATMKAIKAEATHVLWESSQWQKLCQVDLTMPSNQHQTMADSLS